MKKTFASLVAVAGLLAPLPAFADSTTLSGGCSYEAGVQCTAQCQELRYSLQCAAQSDVECTGKLPTMCVAMATASCTGSCQGSCEAKCNVDPPKFDCNAQCSAEASVNCSSRADAECKAEANMGECKAKAEARCKGQAQGECSGKCTATKGSADCKASCQGSCSASCNVSAKVSCDGYLKCQGTAKVMCESELTGGCKTQCSTSGGLLVCNGQVIDFHSTIDSAKAWLAAHGYADASASCSGNTCQAKADAGVSCSVADTSNTGAGSMLAAGLVGLAYAASQMRRRKK